MSRSTTQAPQGTGPPQTTKGLVQLAAPLVISFWLRDAFQLIDVPFASLFGEGALAALSLTEPFGFLLIACWVGASNGLTARLADAMGRGEHARVEQLKRAARRITFALIAAFVALGVAIWFGAEHVGLDPEVAGPFRVYASVFLIGRAATGFWSIIPDSLVKAHHDTRSTMWAGLISGAMNLALNYLFVIVFEWGVPGIALASSFASLGGLLYALRRAKAHEDCRRAGIVDERPGLFDRPVRAILTLAIPSGITFGLMAVESGIINVLLSNTGEQAASLAVWTTINRGARFLTMPMIAVGVAMLPLTARLWGGRQVGRILAELRVGLLAGGLYSAFLVFPLCWFAAPLVAGRLYAEPSTAELATLALRWLPLGIPLGGPFFLVRSTFEGLQRPMPGLIASVIRSLALVLVFVWLGMRIALENGYPQILGAAIGQGVGAGVVTGGLLILLVRTLRRERG